MVGIRYAKTRPIAIARESRQFVVCADGDARRGGVGSMTKALATQQNDSESYRALLSQETRDDLEDVSHAKALATDREAYSRAMQRAKEQRD